MSLDLLQIGNYFSKYQGQQHKSDFTSCSSRNYPDHSFIHRDFIFVFVVNKQLNKSTKRRNRVSNQLLKSIFLKIALSFFRGNVEIQA